MNKTSSFLSVCILLIMQLHFTAFAQTEKPSFQLDNDETGNVRVYRAKNYILLKENFRYQANGSVTFRAFIDPSMNFTIKSIENPSPDSIPDPSLDTPYVPGSTFGTSSEQLPLAIISSPQHQGMSILTYPILWFVTMPLTNNLNGYYRWNEYMGSNTKLNKYLTAGIPEELLIERSKVRAFNFNPAIDLTTTEAGNQISSTVSNFSQSTIMGVWGPKQDIINDQFVFAIHGRRDESLVFTKNRLASPVWNNTELTYGNDTTRNLLYRNVAIENSDSIKFKEKSLRIATVFKSNQPNPDIWGEPTNTLVQLGGEFDTTRVSNVSRFNPSWQQYPAFKGFSPELLLFNKILDENERNIFETYLAIKYGITLDKSYVNRQGKIIWNKQNNQPFHNRVTAYAREDELGLYQKTSTTSYEETPYLSTLNDGDSYESYDTYNSPSQNKLLVIGNQPGNTLLNGQYYVFGDNNDSLKASISVSTDYKILRRSWKLTTNQNEVGSKPQSHTWQLTDLQNYNSDSYLFNLVKSADKQLGYARTESTLIGKDGYLGWKMGQEYGPLTVKFGTATSVVNNHVNDYGYHITLDGQVHFLQNGNVNSYSLFTVEKGQKIEIEKHDRLIFLRVDGVRYKETEMIIDSTKMNYDFYGSIIIGNNPFDVWLNNVRIGGFYDTGNKVELSYKHIPDFLPYLGGNVYLLVDKSGQGNFEGDVDYYRGDEVDTDRMKIVFNNVFWDLDNNGSDVFSFGYYQSSGQSIVKRPPSDQDEPDPVNEILVYYPNMNDLTRVMVKIQTSKPSTALLYLYDMSGRIIYVKDNIETQTLRYEEITLPSNGIYIVKVITDEMRVTKKVISKK